MKGKMPKNFLAMKKLQKKDEISKKCITCGLEFFVSACRKDLAKYCSHRCYSYSLIVETKTDTRVHLAYKKWKSAVHRRDEYMCRIGNKDCEGILEAHHILRWSEYPELRYEVNNGITLCEYHHPIKRDEEKKLVPVFRELIRNERLEILNKQTQNNAI